MNRLLLMVTVAAMVFLASSARTNVAWADDVTVKTITPDKPPDQPKKPDEPKAPEAPAKADQPKPGRMPDWVLNPPGGDPVVGGNLQGLGLTDAQNGNKNMGATVGQFQAAITQLLTDEQKAKWRPGWGAGGSWK